MVENLMPERAASLEDMAFVAELSDHSSKPVAISVSAQEIGRLYASNTSPDAFNQFLLERFKFAGAPVEGVLRYKLAHGAIARVKPNPMEPAEKFDYLWLPSTYVVSIAAAQGVN